MQTSFASIQTIQSGVEKTYFRQWRCHADPADDRADDADESLVVPHKTGSKLRCNRIDCLSATPNGRRCHEM